MAFSNLVRTVMRDLGTVSPKDFGAVAGTGLFSSSARCTSQCLLSVEDVSEKDDLHDQFGVELCY